LTAEIDTPGKREEDRRWSNKLIDDSCPIVAKFFSKGKIVFRIWTNIIRLFLIHGMEQVKV
jgi:hypothetical protein